MVWKYSYIGVIHYMDMTLYKSYTAWQVLPNEQAPNRIVREV